jgi:FemAB-related protein (PEP-CTERM system-associated)
VARRGVNAPTLSMKDGFSGAPLSDAGQWDAYVAGHPDATPFHSRAWCEAITRATGHRCHLATARDAGGVLTGILPLHHIRSPLFGQALVASGFAVGGGILADDPAVAATLAQGAADMAKSLGVPSVELRGGPVPDGEGWTCEEGVYAGFVRDLAADDDAELLAIPRKQRAEVRKVLESGLTVTTGRSDAERRDHYRIYATSVRNLGTPVFPKALFDAVLDAFGDDADILTVRDDGRPVASVLSLFWRGTVMPYWGRRHRRRAAASCQRTDVFCLDAPRSCKKAARASISAARRSAPAPSPTRRIGASNRSRSSTAAGLLRARSRATPTRTAPDIASRSISGRSCRCGRQTGSAR